jgi:hypothetical protein
MALILSLKYEPQKAMLGLLLDLLTIIYFSPVNRPVWPVRTFTTGAGTG